MMSVALRSSKAVQSSYGSTTCVLARPCLSAFSFEASLSASVRGPVQSWALRRLASIWAADDMRMSSIRADWSMGAEGAGRSRLGSDWKEVEYIFGVEVTRGARRHPRLFEGGSGAGGSARARAPAQGDSRAARARAPAQFALT